MSQDQDNFPKCAPCPFPRSNQVCQTEDGKGNTGCPTLEHQDVLKKANKAYEDPETLHFARMASIQEAACYQNRKQQPYTMQPSKTRIEEIIQFARRMGYTRLGLGFCMGLKNEAAMVDKIFSMRGFDMVSAVCKAGRTLKSELGIDSMDQININSDESICNPIYQAELLNAHNTQLNILLGLCVGHDSLFLKNCEAPCTVLAVKDRVTGHNPLAAIYQLQTYYKRLLVPELDEMVEPGQGSMPKSD